jgi:cytochrome c5
MGMSGRTAGFWICAAALSAAIVTGARAQEPDAAPDKGEQLQNAACLGCHDLRPIQTAAFDKDGWTKEVAAMIEKGAVVGDADKPVLIDYLVRAHGPLPDGPGKAILLNTCTVCHDLGRVRRQGGTMEDWGETLGAMLNEGAMLSNQDLVVLLNYLTTNFRMPQ